MMGIGNTRRLAAGVAVALALLAAATAASAEEV